MPTYMHTDADGNVTERVITEAGSLADHGHVAKANDDESGWQREDEPDPETGSLPTDPPSQPATEPEQAPAGRPPQGPRTRRKPADEESADGGGA